MVMCDSKSINLNIYIQLLELRIKFEKFQRKLTILIKTLIYIFEYQISITKNEN